MNVISVALMTFPDLLLAIVGPRTISTSRTSLPRCCVVISMESDSLSCSVISPLPSFTHVHGIIVCVILRMLDIVDIIMLVGIIIILLLLL